MRFRGKIIGTGRLADRPGALILIRPYEIVKDSGHIVISPDALTARLEREGLLDGEKVDIVIEAEGAIKHVVTGGDDGE